MKTIRHGECLLKEVNVLPKGAKLVEEKSQIIVAHSETGHHHLLQVKDKVDLSKIKVYSWNGETYLEVPAISELLHQKTGSNAHKTHTVSPAIYKVILKKEFDYYKGIMKQVRD